jgi:hypothetical protein
MQVIFGQAFMKSSSEREPSELGDFESDYGELNQVLPFSSDEATGRGISFGVRDSGVTHGGHVAV